MLTKTTHKVTEALCAYTRAAAAAQLRCTISVTHSYMVCAAVQERPLGHLPFGIMSTQMMEV